MPLFGDINNKMTFRITVLQAMFIAIFVLYTGRLFAMQIIQGDIHRSRAYTITRRSTILPAQRGEIYTREYQTPVVYNTNAFAVYVSPAEIPAAEIPSILQKLSALLEIPRAQIEKKLPVQSYNFFQQVEIASNVSYKKIASIAEHIDDLPGVSWASKPIRNYSNTGSLSHVSGYVGEITQDELTMLYNQGYSQTDTIGKAGVEKEYDVLLRGKDGSVMRVVDVHGRSAGDVMEQKNPEHGKNIVLTIDSKIQTLVEKALGPRMGAAVVTRPSTGEILAMVSYPWYDPAIFLSSNNGGEYQKLITDNNRPLLNRAIQSHYAPGSTFKIVMTTGLLAENSIPTEKTIECPAEITYGERVWHCHIKKPGHGRVNLHRALALSCDIYYWVAGRDFLGMENIVTYAQEYGFGEYTGIDLPGETAGFVPTPQWKNKKFHEKWLGGDTMNVSIGQGATLVSPIQMANMVSMVVNDGVIYKPYILKEVRDPETGNIIESVKREVLKKSDIDKQIFERVRQDMRGVVNEGTVQYPVNTVRVTEIAGKTGTSEVGFSDRWHSWFAAYAPYKAENPQEQVVISIIVEATNQWEWWAPYASAIIFQGIFAKQTYEEAVAALRFQYLPGLQGRRD